LRDYLLDPSVETGKGFDRLRASDHRLWLNELEGNKKFKRNAGLKDRKTG